jgi:hypothetical protein
VLLETALALRYAADAATRQLFTWLRDQMQIAAVLHPACPIRFSQAMPNGSDCQGAACLFSATQAEFTTVQIEVFCDTCNQPGCAGPG